MRMHSITSGKFWRYRSIWEVARKSWVCHPLCGYCETSRWSWSIVRASHLPKTSTWRCHYKKLKPLQKRNFVKITFEEPSSSSFESGTALQWCDPSLMKWSYSSFPTKAGQVYDRILWKRWRAFGSRSFVASPVQNCMRALKLTDLFYVKWLKAMSKGSTKVRTLWSPTCGVQYARQQTTISAISC